MITKDNAPRYILRLRSTVEPLAGQYLDPNIDVQGAPVGVMDAAEKIAYQLADVSAGFKDLAIMVDAISALASGGSFLSMLGILQGAVSYLKAEFEGAGYQTGVNYGAAQAMFLAWAAGQGGHVWTISQTPGWSHLSAIKPTAPGSYIFVRALQGEKNDRTDLYHDPLWSNSLWMGKAIGEDWSGWGWGIPDYCQDNVALGIPAGKNFCPIADVQGKKVIYFPILFPLHSPARFAGYSRIGGFDEGFLALQRAAANTLTTLTPQHMITREAEIDKAQKILTAGVKDQYPDVFLTEAGWVNRPDKAFPPFPAFPLSAANEAYARIKAFRNTRRAIKLTMENAPMVLPGWALTMAKANPDFPDI